MNTPTKLVSNFPYASDPFFIGFDNIVERLHKQANNSGNYPPYNIIKTGDTSYIVEIAVAGFTKEDIDITLQEGSLTIEGKPVEVETTSYVHKGIASRAFTRKFTLADTIEVKGADLNNGMLQVFLENIIPEAKKPRKIEIMTNVGSKQFLAEYDGDE